MKLWNRAASLAAQTPEARNRLDRHYEGILQVIAFNKSDTLNGRKS